MSNPPRTPADGLAAIILRLVQILDGLSMYGPFPRPLALLIFDRLRAIQQRFRRIADRVAAGIHVPRRYPSRRPPAAAKPRRPNPLPTTFGWLKIMVPEAVQYAGQLEYLFRDPEMAALLASAPAPLRRPLRSLCRMLGITPPPILAPPAKPRPPRRPRAKTPRREPLQPYHPATPPEAPAWMRGMPRLTRYPWGRTRRLPKKA